MKTSSVFFKYKLASVLKSRLYIFDSLVMLAGTAFSFFTRTKFFSPAGTSSLTPYFSFVPFVSVLVIPAFCLKKDSEYDSFVPLAPLKKLLINFLAHAISYILMLTLLLWMPLFVQFYGDVDWGAVFISYFVLVFYGLTAVSLCFFINDLSSDISGKTVTAFVISVLTLLAITSPNILSVYFNLSSFLSKIFLFFSFAARFDKASKGIFSSSDFLFYLISTFLFLFLCFIVSEKKKGKVFKNSERKRAIFIFIILVLLFANNERLNFTVDFSKDRIYSVSDYTKKLLKESEDSVTIHFYKSSKLENIYPSVRNVSSFLRDYVTYGENISLKISDCDKDENARNLLNNYGIYPQRIRTEDSTSTEFIDVYSAIVIESSGALDIIPFVISPESLEYNLDVKLLKILFDFTPEVNVLIGNDFLETDLQMMTAWFYNQDISVKFITPENIPDVAGPLFIIGETYLDQNDISNIDNYIKNGSGNVLVMSSPYVVDIKGDWTVSETKNHKLTDLIFDYGISYNPSLVMDYSCQRISMVSEESGADFAEIINYPLWINVLPQNCSKLGFTLFWASPLDLTENAKPFILSSAHSYEERFDFDNPAKIIETNPFETKLKNVTTMSLQNQIIGAYSNYNCTDNVYTKSQLYVIPDSLFASYNTNAFIGGESGDFRNFIFLTKIFWEMNGNSEIAQLQSKTSRDTSLYKKNNILQK